MERLNSDMINEIFRYLDPSYIIFSTFYVSKRIMEMSIRFLNFMNVVKLKKKSLFKALCRDIKDEVSIERFIGFGEDDELSNFNIYLGAIEYDNLELLRYMTEIEKFTDYEYTSTEVYKLCEFEISSYFIKYKLYACIKYMCTNIVPKFVDENIYLLSENTCSYAAKYDSIECLKYAHEHGCKMNSYICSNAVKYGSIECLKYGYENRSSSDILEWDEVLCKWAAEYDSDEILRYLHENGCPWDEETCSSAAISGSLECLKYAHENGCPWDEWVYYNASEVGSLECFLYAFENGCPWDQCICSNASRGG